MLNVQKICSLFSFSNHPFLQLFLHFAYFYVLHKCIDIKRGSCIPLYGVFINSKSFRIFQFHLFSVEFVLNSKLSLLFYQRGRTKPVPRFYSMPLHQNEYICLFYIGMPISISSPSPFLLLGFVFQFIARYLLYTPEQSSRRISEWRADLSHHRAYRPVHCGSTT